VGKDGTSVMSNQQHQTPSSQNDHLPWWIRLCRWLWKASGFLGVVVFLALGINVASTWLTTPKGAFPADTPLSALMTNWPISLLIGCCLFLLALIFWAISRWNVPSSTITAAITPQDRERMLRRLRVRYEQLLDQSLQGAVEIELGLASRPAAIHNAISLSLRLPEQPEQALPAHASILDAYHLAQQELLILGEPGAGKSMLLLKLAQHLVEQAEQDMVQPLPVVLPLSSWATKHLLLQDWLIEQFALLYDVPRQLSHDWVQAGFMLPLLDGLDEMEELARPACIAAINTYHRKHLQPLVVCSRTTEHDTATLHERLALHTAIVVQPLTLAQIDAHLTTIGKPLTALRTTLNKNTTLQTLATTPLLLQILMLTYHDIPVWGLSHKENQLQEQIWSDYVQRMVNRKGGARRYPPHIITAWLSFLARQMRMHNQTIFILEQLQPDWLLKERRTLYQWSFRLVNGLLFGLVVGLGSGLGIGLVGGLVNGLVNGLFFGLVGGLVGGLGLEGRLDGEIEPVEALTWMSEDQTPRQQLAWLFAGLSIGLFVGLAFGLFVGLGIGLFVGLGVGLLSLLLAGLESKQLAERQVFSPNEGIRHSIKNGLFVGLAPGLFAGLFVGLIDKQPDRLGTGLFLGLLVGLGVGQAFGLRAALQHYLLRFWLWRSHLFPLQAVPFLEDATARVLLRRVGGGYSFTHRLLLDYFADLETTPVAPSSPPTPLP
jgi:NACHT domain